MKRHIYHLGYFHTMCGSRKPFFIQWVDYKLTRRPLNCEKCYEMLEHALHVSNEGECSLCNVA